MNQAIRKPFVKLAVFTILSTAILAAIFLTLLVNAVPIAKTDISLSKSLQENGDSVVLFIMQAISIWGDPWLGTITVVAAAILFIAVQYQREALFILLTFFTDSLIVFLKSIVGRPRPSSDFINIYENFGGYSFPSSHVVHYVVFFGLLFAFMVMLKTLPFLVRLTVGAISIILIIGISISRVYLGAHWASDVIGGYIFGFIMVSILLYAYFWAVGKFSTD